ncbi:MAG: DUF2946 family protein [Burkholderiales bacterium]|nr:DUF2946 family protein [Burkholderiales bacterium]
MDDIVKAAMLKWPQVPHCYGWLALDARGNWRMRDAHCQATGNAGDKIHNIALIAFINRNYQSDEMGRYYFQNGPQKVYVDLACTPYICHYHQDLGWQLHTGVTLPTPSAVHLLDDGQIVFTFAHSLAQVDDRDLAYALTLIRQDKLSLSDDAILSLLDQRAESTQLPHIYFELNGQVLPLYRSALTSLIAQLGIQTLGR